MHIEKNVFDNVFNKFMDVKGKTKDNAKYRAYLKEFCSLLELHKDERVKNYPMPYYTLDNNGREEY